jgi:adenylate kinase
MHKPHVAGVCDACGGTAFTRRPDDEAATVQARLKAYHEQTAPLLPYYAAQARLFTVDGMGEPEAVQAEILAVLRYHIGLAAAA